VSGGCYASPVAADGHVFIASERGKVAVLPPGGSLTPIVTNDLGEDLYATPAVADGRIYIRTTGTLWAFGG
jgi:outer membrane protein assembly factor BamB